MLYLGEINDSQQRDWCRAIEVFDEGTLHHTQLALFLPIVRFPNTRRRMACSYGSMPWNCIGRGNGARAGWRQLYEQLGLDRFWAERLPPSREGTCWQHILQTLVCYRLIDPGSEWRLHRQWFEQSAMADLLAEIWRWRRDALYRCLDKLLPHKEVLFWHLRQRWQDFVRPRFDVLLYDLTSTYFESAPPDDEADKRRHGYSRDKRQRLCAGGDCADRDADGFPLGYEVLAGNTCDKTTLRGMLRKIEARIRQGQPHLGDGSGHSDRRGACRDASGRSASLIWSEPQGAALQIGKALLTLPGKLSARAWTSSFCRRTRNSTCWRKATRAFTRNVPCAGASSSGYGRASSKSRPWTSIARNCS